MPDLGVYFRPYPSLDLLSLKGFQLLLFKVWSLQYSSSAYQNTTAWALLSTLSFLPPLCFSQPLSCLSTFLALDIHLFFLLVSGLSPFFFFLQVFPAPFCRELVFVMLQFSESTFVTWTLCTPIFSLRWLSFSTTSCLLDVGPSFWPYYSFRPSKIHRKQNCYFLSLL